MQCTNINFDNLPSSISEFFTPEQFAEISEYEKQLLSNLRQHFEALQSAGLPVTPPEFMLINRSEKERRKLVNPAVIESSDGSDSEWTPALEKPKKPSGRKLVTPAVIESSDGSDYEWTPALEKPKRPSVNQRKRLFEPPKKASSKDNTKDKIPGPMKRRKQRKKQTDSDDEEEEVHVSQFRIMRMSSYMSLATLDDDDDLLYCEECRQEYHGDCPVHGPLLCIDDIERKKQTDSDDEAEEGEVHAYPFRIMRMSSYMSLATLDDDDDLLYCEECRQEYHGDCPVHGPLLCIDDIEVYYDDSYANNLGIQSPKYGNKIAENK